MGTKRQVAAVLGIGALLASLTLLLIDPAQGQKINPKKGLPVPPSSPGGGNAALYSAIKLVEDSDLRQYIAVAQDCIKDKAWNDAITALQFILDKKQDFFVQVRQRDSRGQETVRWASVKFEANNLLASMHEDGLSVYEVRYGGMAKLKLDEAKRSGSRDLLGEVATRFMNTEAGAEANDLLATYFLDRGQFFMSALRFERLLAMNPERVKISDLTLFKAALAFRRAGDAKNAEQTWRKLEQSLRAKGGLKINDDLISIAKLQQVLDEIPRSNPINPHDWPLIRGNDTNTAQAHGSPPLLDLVLWSRRLFLDKEPGCISEDEKGNEAKTWIERAITNQAGLANTPVLPGCFPIAVGNMLVYRSYSDIRAVYLQDGKDASGPYKAGEIAWKSTEFDGALACVLAEPKLRTTLETWLNQYAQLPGFINLVYENTLAGTLATDHRLVYAVDDLAVPAIGNIFQPYVWNSPQVPQDIKPLVMQNTLWAYNLQTGKADWRLGDPLKKDEFSDSHFLGVPMSVGGKLYVLNEKNNGPQGDSELRLVVIDPYKGQVINNPNNPKDPIPSIATVQQQHRFTHDMSRRTNAVHMAYGEGILVCPTHAGEVLGIDLLTRSLAWAYPYREQAPVTKPVMPNPGIFPPNANLAYVTANWKSSPPAIQDGKVVFTAPDANSVHCINLRDGIPVWRKSQLEGDLYMAGVFNGKVLIVGKNAVRCLHLADGNQLWYLPTGDLPSGQGVASKNIYYLPLKKGELLAIDMERGIIKARNRATKPGVSPGNLVFYEGAVISQTPNEIVAYPQLTAILDKADRELAGDPKNPGKLIHRGELRLADGQVQAAVNDLHEALANNPGADLTPRAKLRLYEAFTDLFQVDFNNASPKYLDEYRDLCKVDGNPEEQKQRQAKFFRIVGQGREGQGNLVDAFEMYKSFGDLNKEGVAAIDDPTHKVPANIWLRGRISAMITKATPEQRQPLEARIAELWKQEKGKNDIDSIRNFVGMFDVPFTVGREARLQLAEAIMERKERNSFLEAELSLQQLRTGAYKDDPAIGGRALASLALLEEKKSTNEAMKLAAAYYREISRDFPKAILRDGKTGADLFNAMAEDKRFLPFLEEATTLWSKAKFGYRELAPGNFDQGLQGFIFQPEGDITPLMKHHRLVLDPSNANNPELRLLDLTTNTVRWRTNLGSVQTNFQFFQYLYQQAQANFAYHPNARFRFFQVKGHLAVFQVGTMAYCLDLDNPRLLWQHNLLDGNLQQPNVMVQQVMPDEKGNLEVILRNNFNGQITRMAVGMVGAVQASYVALATQKGLVVLDPLRGTTLWSKMDVPARTQVFGDDRHIYLVDSGMGAAGSGRALRGSDGVPVDVQDFGYLYQNRIRLFGQTILAAMPTKDGLNLRLYDIPSGKDLWAKTFDNRAVVLQTEDPNLTGVIESDGKMHVFEVPSGKELLITNVLQGRVTLEDIKALKEPLLLQDNERYYVALNKPIDTTVVQSGIISNNFSNGLRCGHVNGWFLAFHKQDGERKEGERVLRWKKGDLNWHPLTPTTNQMIVLEQFHNLPVILFSSRYNELIKGGASGNRWVSNTQTLHKNTGKMIYDVGPRISNSAAQYYGFTIDLKAGTINMVGFGGILQHFVDDGRKSLPEVRSEIPRSEPDIFGPTGLYRVDGNLANTDGRHRNKIHKMYSLKLNVGRSYTIHHASNQFDAYLYLEDAGGTLLAQDDDGGGGLNAQIVFRPQQTGFFRIIATSLGGSSTGNFTLTVRQQ